MTAPMQQHERETATELPGRRRATRLVQAPPAAVWDVLADGWLYATWVVGTSRVRAVHPRWPEVGSTIDHSFGVWPAVIDDETRSLLCVPEQLLHLQARGWPMGEARVELSLVAREDEVGPGSTWVSLVEDAVAGPGVVVPEPVRQAGIVLRNAEALRRLAFIAEGRHRDASGPGPAGHPGSRA